LITGSIAVVVVMYMSREMYGLLTNTFYAAGYQLAKTGLGQVSGGNRLMDYYQENDLHGPIFNNFDIGSYLIYRLYPKDKVFVDGRPEAYPAAFFTDTYIPMQYDQSKWDEAMKKYHFQTIIISHTDATPWGRAFLQRIIKDPQWNLVYFDDWGMILVNTDGAAGMHTLSAADKFDTYAQARIQSTDEVALLARYANFFQIIGREDLFTLTVEKIH
jgi:hypothetical protein